MQNPKSRCSTKIQLYSAVFMIIAFCGAIQAQSSLGFKGIGGKLGYVNPSGVSSTIGFGVFADLGTISPKIQLEANFDYWSKSTSEISSFRDISFGGIARYLFGSNPAVVPFAEAGLALHILSSDVEEVTLFGQTTDFSSSSTKLGFDLGGGVLYKVSPQFDLLGEVKYRLVSTVDQLALNVGVVYRLGS